MTLEQLRIFLAVAVHLHFTRAAEELYITQPAVSAAVSSLEKEYGVKLFHRVGRHIEITEAGKLLEIEAQKILDRVSLAERGLHELNNLQRGELKIGSSLTVGNYWLPEKISQFKREYSGILVNCTLAKAEEICDGTAAGLFDIGLVTGEIKPALKGVLLPSRVGSERLLIVVGKTHPWYESPRVSVADLPSTGWVMRESGSGAQQVFERSIAQWGLNPDDLTVILALSTSEMVKAVVESGVGAAAIPELIVRNELRLGSLKEVHVVDATSGRRLEIIQPIIKLKHRERFQSRVAAKFEQMLEL